MMKTGIKLSKTIEETKKCYVEMLAEMSMDEFMPENYNKLMELAFDSFDQIAELVEEHCKVMEEQSKKLDKLISMMEELQA